MKPSYITKILFCLKISKSINLFFLTSILLSIVFCLEFLSIGSLTLIFNFLGDSSNTDSILMKIGLIKLDNYLRQDIKVFSIFVILIFLIKNIILLTVIFLENYFVLKLNTNLSKSLYNHYTNKNLLFFKNNNSSLLFRNMTEIKRIGGLFKTLQLFMREVIIVFSMITIMLFANPILTSYLLFTLIISIACFYFLYKNFSNKFGKEFQKEDGNRIKSFYEGIDSNRESKIYDISNFLKGVYLNALIKVEKSILKTNILTSIPKIYFELIAIISFMIIIYISFEDNNLIYMLSIFAIATLKLLPSFQSIVSNFGFINFYNVALNLIYDEFKNNEFKQNEFLYNNRESNFSSLNFSNIHFKYPEKEAIINKLNLEIKKNDKICIFGESGSGKSTLLDIISGLIEPTSGDILLNGQIIKNPIEKIKIGFIPQDVFIYDSNIVKNITLDFNMRNLDQNLLDSSIKAAQLNDLFDKGNIENNIITGQSGKKISGGQKQRIGIARALYHNFEILLLDEFTNSLDKENEKKIFNLVLSLNKTIICVTHNKDNFQYFDRVYLLKDKKLKVWK